MPSEGIGTSPAQSFLGRRCKTFLPIISSKLKLEFSTHNSAEAQKKQRCQQQAQHAKELKPISKGQTICIRLPGKVGSPHVALNW